MFEASEDVEFDYRFSLVHLALKSIRESDETCLQVLFLAVSSYLGEGAF